MTKEITKAFIIQEIQDKFKLREFEPEVFTFSEQVIPVYNIEPHVQKWTTKFVEKSVTATGNKLFFTVPQTEKWRLRRYDVIFMGAGAYTLAGANIVRVGGYTIYLDLAAAKSASYHIGLRQDVILNAGDTLNINVDGYTSTQDLRLYIDYQIEEIR